MENTEKRAELTKELRTARKYLAGVAILMFVVDMVMLMAQREQLTSDGRNLIIAIDSFILGLFFALAYFVPRAPRFCLGAGLVLFWLIQFVAAYGDWSQVYRGLIVKILFTMALWKGFQSASKAQSLSRDLARVFE